MNWMWTISSDFIFCIIISRKYCPLPAVPMVCETHGRRVLGLFTIDCASFEPCHQRITDGTRIGNATHILYEVIHITACDARDATPDLLLSLVFGPPPPQLIVIWTLFRVWTEQCAIYLQSVSIRSFFLNGRRKIDWVRKLPIAIIWYEPS